MLKSCLIFKTASYGLNNFKYWFAKNDENKVLLVTEKKVMKTSKYVTKWKCLSNRLDAT